jgi:hypothetical protein
MSRSGYSDDCDGWALIRWRGAVASAIRGARGQAFIREAIAALDAMPDKRLVADSLVEADGKFCTLGIVGQTRGLPLAALDPEDRDVVAQAFGISTALAAEVMFMNDEAVHEPLRHRTFEVCGPMRPFDARFRSVRAVNSHLEELRWQRMRNWLESHLAKEPA